MVEPAVQAPMNPAASTLPTEVTYICGGILLILNTAS